MCGKCYGLPLEELKAETKLLRKLYELDNEINAIKPLVSWCILERKADHRQLELEGRLANIKVLVDQL